MAINFQLSAPTKSALIVSAGEKVQLVREANYP